MRLTADHRKKVVNIPPRCMMSTTTLEIANMIIEEQNKQQYESFLTSALNNGNLDAVVSYEEWLKSIHGYRSDEAMAGDTKVRTRKEWSILLQQLGIDFD